MTVSPRIIDVPHTDSVLKIGAVSDAVAAAIQQGMQYLGDHMQDNSSKQFRVFVDELHDTIVREGTYELSGVLQNYVLTDEECYYAITVLLPAANHFAPTAMDELIP